MKKLFIVLITCIIFPNALTLLAAKDTTTKVNPIKVGAYGALSLPLGSFSDNANIGYGIIGSVDYIISPNKFISAIIGYIHFPTPDDSRYYSNIPLLMSFVYTLEDDLPNLFIGIEAGLIFQSLNFTQSSYMISETLLGFAPKIGAQTQLNDKITFRGMAKFNYFFNITNTESKPVNTIQLDFGLVFSI
jgi:hypothetical protein